MVDPGDAGATAVPYVAPMAHGQLDTPLPAAAVERLSTAFNRCFETLDAPHDLFTPDAFFDLLPPFWRLQLRGPDALAAQLRAISTGPATARILRVVPTATGFVLEHEETQRLASGEVEVARRLHLCEVRDGAIAEVVTYCNGGWDAPLRARHAAEAPMLRREGERP
jgi:hypothetical protein